MKKFYIRTFGCQMNEYDSSKIIDILNSQANLIKTHALDEADIVILNTCSIREKAAEKVFSDLGRLKELKDKKSTFIIALGGCIGSQEGKNIFTRVPYIDIIFGPQTIHRLPQLLFRYYQTGLQQIDVSFPEIEKFDYLPQSYKKQIGSAYVSIMEGCSKYCSYCIVPYTRGTEFSRPLEDVLTEIALLAQQGAKEVNLLGQNVNAYRGSLNKTDEIIDFPLLLEYISEIPEIRRIRFTTSHPKEFTKKLIDCYANLKKLVNHLHLPVQHASDKLLSSMKRGYTILEYKNIIRKIREIRPNLSLSSDFIIGFPGETERDFEILLQFIEEMYFDNSFCFIYSKRPGTPAANIPDNVPYSVKLDRLKKVISIIDQHTLEISKSMLGKREFVMIEGIAKDGKRLKGRTENNRIVNVNIENKNINDFIGQFSLVQYTEVLTHSLRGELVM